ncbi:MAG: condensation domain-containing protein, partial [Bacteroidota bacterium]
MLSSLDIFDLDFADRQGRSIADQITRHCSHCQKSLDIVNGPLLRAVFMTTPSSEVRNRLLLVVHHLLIDGVSWRILLTQLIEALKAVQMGRDIQLGNKTTSYRQWQQGLASYALHPAIQAQRSYWKRTLERSQPLPTDFGEALSLQKDVRTVQLFLSQAQTQLLLHRANAAYQTQVDDLLLTALVMVIASWSAQEELLIGLEGHGRESFDEQLDVSQTVGWFTNLYPVRLQLSTERSLDWQIKSIKEQIRAIPEKGRGYGLLRQSLPKKDLELVFNYLGQFDNVLGEEGDVQLASESVGPNLADTFPFSHKLLINASVMEGRLQISWSYSVKNYRAETIEQLATQQIEQLMDLVDHCVSKTTSISTPSDLGLAAHMSFEELDEFWDKGQRREQLEEVYALSPMQEGMLYYDLYNGHSEAYFLQLMVEFLDELDAVVFRRSLQQLLSEHSILRTAFFPNELPIPVQAVFREVDIPFEEIDIRQLTPSAQKKYVDRYKAKDRAKGFDLTRPPLMRICLFKLGNHRSQMVWSYHHLLLDGWSQPIVFESLFRHYETLKKGHPPLPKEEDRYRAYIQHLAARDGHAEEEFWKKYLVQLEGPSLLPFVEPTEDRNSGIGLSKEVVWEFGEQLTTEAQAFAQSHQLTLNTLMQGVWGILLCKYTEREDAVYGVTLSGRPEQLSAVERRVGLYINTIPLRIQFAAEKNIVDWLQLLQQSHAEARVHQHSSLSDVQRWSGIQADLFDSILVFENYPIGEALSKNWSLKVGETRAWDKTNYLLSIIAETGDNLRLKFVYNSNFLKRSDVLSIKRNFEKVLQDILCQPSRLLSELSLLNQQEKQRILFDFNDTTVSYPAEETVLDLLLQQFAENPNHIAIRCGEDCMTYGELDERSGRLAHHLQQRKAQSGQIAETDSLVALCTDRSFEMVIGLIGIWRAGSAFVAIDPTYPLERIRYILDDAKAEMLVVDASHRQKALEWQKETTHLKTILCLDEELYSDVAFAPIKLRPDQLAYVIHTSGSTNKPKGVMIPHSALHNFISSMRGDLQADASMKWLAVTTISFDISYLEIFLPLVVGGQLVIASRTAAADGELLKQLLARETPSHLQATPAGWQILRDCGWENNEQLQAITGGEAISESLKNWLTSLGGARVWNLYGPTETTIYSALESLSADRKVSI